MRVRRANVLRCMTAMATSRFHVETGAVEFSDGRVALSGLHDPLSGIDSDGNTPIVRQSASSGNCSGPAAELLAQAIRAVSVVCRTSFSGSGLPAVEQVADYSAPSRGRVSQGQRCIAWPSQRRWSRASSAATAPGSAERDQVDPPPLAGGPRARRSGTRRRAVRPTAHARELSRRAECRTTEPRRCRTAGSEVLTSLRLRADRGRPPRPAELRR